MAKFGSESSKVDLTNLVKLSVKLEVWDLREKSVDLVIDISSSWNSKLADCCGILEPLVFFPFFTYFS